MCYRKLFVVSMDSSVGRVAASSKSILFSLYAGFESHQCFHFYRIIFSYFHMYEGQSKISESWLISFDWVALLTET